MGTMLVMFSTWLYSSPDRRRPPPISIVEYEKTTIHNGDNSYTPRYEEDKQHMLLDPRDSVKAVGLSSSRPSSPMRHSSRTNAKRED